MAGKVFGDVFDRRTVRSLSLLRRKKYYDSIKGVISSGKESTVFLAEKDGKPLAIKIYMIEKLKFDKMWDYLYGDPRFFHVKKSFPNIIYAWAEKEFSNLAKARRAGVDCPEPIKFNKNVLIMEFIGKNENPSQRAKDAHPRDPGAWYKSMLSSIKKLYKKECLVHGDLSEYNVLNNEEKPVIIDFSQGILKEHPLFQKLLERDIKNVNAWFSKLGVKTKNEKRIIDKLK